MRFQTSDPLTLIYIINNCTHIVSLWSLGGHMYHIPPPPLPGHYMIQYTDRVSTDKHVGRLCASGNEWNLKSALNLTFWIGAVNTIWLYHHIMTDIAENSNSTYVKNTPSFSNKSQTFRGIVSREEINKMMIVPWSLFNIRCHG